MVHYQQNLHPGSLLQTLCWISWSNRNLAPLRTLLPLQPMKFLSHSPCMYPWVFGFFQSSFPFFFLMWTIFKVFIEFVTILLLFYVLLGFFLPWGMWDLRLRLNHWTTREVPCTCECLGDWYPCSSHSEMYRWVVPWHSSLPVPNRSPSCLCETSVRTLMSIDSVTPHFHFWCYPPILGSVIHFSMAWLLTPWFSSELYYFNTHPNNPSINLCA